MRIVSIDKERRPHTRRTHQKGSTHVIVLQLLWAQHQRARRAGARHARLAIWLLDEAARGGSPRIAATHDEIARHLGSAREVVSRMLKYFAREGLVRLSRGAVEIVDARRLRQLTA